MRLGIDMFNTWDSSPGTEVICIAINNHGYSLNYKIKIPNGNLELHISKTVLTVTFLGLGKMTDVGYLLGT
jgi:hypothetical protein